MNMKQCKFLPLNCRIFPGWQENRSLCERGGSVAASQGIERDIDLELNVTLFPFDYAVVCHGTNVFHLSFMSIQEVGKCRGIVTKAVNGTISGPTTLTSVIL
jgi:hypothetical protein